MDDWSSRGPDGTGPVLGRMGSGRQTGARHGVDTGWGRSTERGRGRIRGLDDRDVNLDKQVTAPGAERQD